MEARIDKESVSLFDKIAQVKDNPAAADPCDIDPGPGIESFVVLNAAEKVECTWPKLREAPSPKRKASAEPAAARNPWAAKSRIWAGPRWTWATSPTTTRYLRGALRYGTVPVVRATGGLDDSVIDYGQSPDLADGVKFYEYTSRALAKAIRKALAIYDQPELLRQFRRNAMRADFTWGKVRGEYVKVYGQTLKTS